ncbi:MAG: ATP-binding protein, partial [Kofleriaceae bacterium]
LGLIEAAMRGAADELGVELIVRRDGAQLLVEGKALARRVIEVCNGRAQGGHLGGQLDALRALATGGAVPVALRNSDFQFKAKTKISKQLGDFLAAGGRKVVLEERQLRAIAAARVVAEAHPQAFATWKRTHRPITHLAFVREILDLDQAPRAIGPQSTQPMPQPRPPAPPAPPAPASATTSATPAPPPTPAPGIASSGAIPVVDPSQLRLGETTTMRRDPVTLALDHVKTHVAFLGTTGSGKTTAALGVVEQLLERGVSVLLVDRKGDLARYASDAWWRDPDSGDPARKAALRARIDVSLFTPGNAQGRPLRLPLIPRLSDATTQETEQLAKFAAGGIAAMMGYGTSSTHQHKQSILQRAIQLHVEEREVTIDVLRETINQPDPELLVSVGPLQRFFAQLSEDLQTLSIQRGSLLAGEGEPLDVAALLPIGGRPRLSIINTAAFSEIAVLQFWVSRLLVELARLSRKRPSAALQGAAFFDEADAYIPAIGSPPTKEPMFELLRRARSGGLGVLLATQNPGDFDYKARDLISTWLVGKVGQDRAIQKMRNLLSSYPNVGPRLATQPTGHFFVLASSSAREIKCDRSLMLTEQLSDHEVLELARTNRPG